MSRYVVYLILIIVLVLKLAALRIQGHSTFSKSLDSLRADVAGKRSTWATPHRRCRYDHCRRLSRQYNINCMFAIYDTPTWVDVLLL
jgi:hypothetical protein